MKFQEIPCIRLNNTQKKKALEILNKGVVLLKKWSVFFPPKKTRQLRNAIMQGNKNPNNVIPEDRLDEFHNDIPFIIAIRHGIYADLGNKSVEQAILEHFSAMAKKHAGIWATERDVHGLTKQDLLQEAYMTVVEAMYHWTETGGADISTVIYVSLKNHFSNTINKSNPLCPLTNADLNLVIKYERAKRKMDEYVTFDEIVDSLGLSTDEGKYLNSLLTRVFSENQLVVDQNKENDFDNDYTVNRVGIDKESEVDTIIQNQHVKSTLERANLTSVEQELIVASMNPYSGWQTDWANNHINPKTQKPYSRMRVSQVLAVAREKVARVLKAA